MSRDPFRPSWYRRRHVPSALGNIIDGVLSRLPGAERRALKRRSLMLEAINTAGDTSHHDSTAHTHAVDGMTVAHPNPDMDPRAGPVAFASPLGPRRRKAE